jgi:hypothetical protein
VKALFHQLTPNFCKYWAPIFVQVFLFVCCRGGGVGVSLVGVNVVYACGRLWLCVGECVDVGVGEDVGVW